MPEKLPTPGSEPQEPTPESTHEQLFENVAFIDTVKNAGAPTESHTYKSSSPDRKIMVLTESSVTPEPGQAYHVRVIEDTEPTDPMKGKLVVEIVLDPAEHQQKLTTLASEARQSFDANDLQGTLEKLRELKKLAGLKDEGFLEFLETKFGLWAQYENQIKLLEKLGIPDTLEGQSRPTEDEVGEKLLQNKELFEKKIEQGFTQLLIVPFGLSLQSLVEKYAEQLKLHQSAGKLFSEGEGPTLQSGSGQAASLKLDTKDPVYMWDGYEKEDLVYFPTAFDSNNHGGLTKEQAIAKEGAWQIYLVEETSIPRAGKGAAKNGRKQLETNLSPKEYLEKLQTDPQYAQEVGLTPELWLMKALTRLDAKNEVIDDYRGKGSVSYNLGAYFPKSAFVASACWGRDFSRAFLGRLGAGYRGEYGGASSAVPV